MNFSRESTYFTRKDLVVFLMAILGTFPLISVFIMNSKMEQPGDSEGITLTTLVPFAALNEFIRPLSSKTALPD